MGQLLGKAQFLTKAQLAVKKVTFKNGDYTFVREMTGKERNIFEKSILKQTKDSKGEVQITQDMDNFKSKLAVCTVCDDKGKLLFTIADVEKLSENISSAMLEEIVKESQVLNALIPEVKKEILKN